MIQHLPGPLPPDLRDAIGRLRVLAWASRGVEVAAEDGLLLDPLDELGHHFFALRDRRIVGTCRLTVHRGEALPDGLSPADAPGHEVLGVLGRMAVAGEARGKGLAARLDQARLAKARALGCGAVLVCTSNPARVPALEALGFRCGRAMRSQVTGLEAQVLALELP